MIIFTSIRDLPEAYLQYKGIKQVIKFNLNSLYAYIPSLDLLNPSIANLPEDMTNTTPEFDIMYHKYIFENDAVFNQFMSIVVPANVNPECLVQVLVKFSEYRDIITESLIKLIQQRYGYNSYIISDAEDFLYVEESDFSIPGLFLFEQDRTRWFMLNGVPAEED